MVPSIQTHPSIVSNQLLKSLMMMISHFNTKTRERIFKRQFEPFSGLHLRGAESDIKSPISWCFFICISKFSTYFVLYLQRLHFSSLIYIWALAWSVIVWWWRLWLMSRHITKQLQVVGADIIITEIEIRDTPPLPVARPVANGPRLLQQQDGIISTGHSDRRMWRIHFGR